MVDLVQVTVDGLPVRVSGDYLGVKVELERGRDELLLQVDSERLAVVGTELRVKGGAKGRTMKGVRIETYFIMAKQTRLTQRSYCWPTR